MRRKQLLFFLSIICFQLNAQQTVQTSRFALESSFHTGYIVRNSGDVPENQTPFFVTINPSVQTNGSEDWHQILGFPRVGFKFTYGSLGNRKELGNLLGFTPNMTFKTSANRWYLPSVNLGLGIAWFNKPYDETENPRNFYIGSHITALAEASLQIEPRIGKNTFLVSGFRVMHCSNSHYQVPNLGINILSVYLGLLINPASVETKPEIRTLNIPEARIRFNIRSGLGVHELARTFGPAGSPKYVIYVNDIYLSRRFGKLSNVHAGLEVNYYNSYYQYIVRQGFFEDDRKLKSTVITAFLAHELMIKRFSFLTQGGINLHNKFYNAYISQYKSEKGMGVELKKHISTRLGVQYYLFDPKYCTRKNVFIGAYIKANFGQADFFCMQMGVVL